MTRHVTKWEKAVEFRPINNIISSDFSKYNPRPWKFMEGDAKMGWTLSYEYLRMWLHERDEWNKRMYPDSVMFHVDVVKNYVQTFKASFKPPKPEKKEPFRMKKFDKVNKTMSTKRPSDDKAMAFKKEKDTERKQRMESLGKKEKGKN